MKSEVSDKKPVKDSFAPHLTSIEESDPFCNFVFSLGSNFGDRSRNVASAIEWLAGFLTDLAVSDIYETPAYGHNGSPYMNAVVRGRLRQSGGLQTLQQACKEYELLNGRDGEARKNNRVPIDIDIVMAGETILRETDFSRGFFQQGYRQISDQSGLQERLER